MKETALRIALGVGPAAGGDRRRVSGSCEPGDRIRPSAAEFERLAKAFFADVQAKFLQAAA